MDTAWSSSGPRNATRCTEPSAPWVSILGWGMQLPLSCLQVQPVAKLIMCPRDTSPPPKDTNTAGHTDCHRQGAFFNSTHRQYSHQTQAQAAMSPLLLGWQRQKVTSVAHTRRSPGSQAHAHSWIPWAPAWLDPGLSYPPHGSPAHQLVHLGAHCKHTALTHLSHKHSAFTSPPRHTSTNPPITW